MVRIRKDPRSELLRFGDADMHDGLDFLVIGHGVDRSLVGLEDFDVHCYVIRQQRPAPRRGRRG